MKKISRLRASTIVLISLVIIMAAVLCVCGAVIIKLQRINLFSKSILLSNNYFLENLELASDEENSDEDSLSSEYYEFPGSDIEKNQPLSIDLYRAGVNSKLSKKILSWMQDIESMDPKRFAKFSQSDIAFELLSLYTIGNSETETVRETCKTFGIDFDPSKLKLLDPNKSKQITIDYLSQEGILPNGCEAVSATMMLNFYGVNISPEDFVDNYLCCKDVSIRWGCRYGPNPKYAYAGDPRTKDKGWGCFAPVIVRAINEALPDGYTSKNLTGISMSQLKDYIDQDIPVAVWVTVNMEEVGRILQWQSDDGNETFLYPANEHCMVLVGYDEEGFIFADPYESKGIVKYPAQDTLLAFNSLGRQAVAIMKDS